MTIRLPLQSETVRCSDFARSNAVDPGGTALAPDVVVLVEVPAPWPKPAGKHAELADLVAVAAAHPEPVRLLAALPRDPNRRRIIGFRRAAGGAARSETRLGSDPVADLRSVLNGEGAVDVSTLEGPRTVLVCTQGSHDVCCGVDGLALADALESTQPALELFRVSHTGGHRFAPTAMTLPDGRMWAYLDVRTMSSILDRSIAPEVAAGLCRGWWGGSTGPAQIGERAVFAHVGWDLDHRERFVTASANDDGTHSVVVTTIDDSWEVTVEPGREVPTIACDAAGGQPVKPGREWTVGHVPIRIG